MTALLHDEHLAHLFSQHMRPLRQYLDAPEVQEIMVNAPHDIWIEAKGQMFHLDIELDPKRVEAALVILREMTKRAVDNVLDARTPGFRFAAVLHPLAIHGHAIAVRKHPRKKRPIDQYLQDGLLTRIPKPAIPDELRAPPYEAVAQGGEALVQFLRSIMAAARTVLVSGGTSTGKTTLLNALIDLIPQHVRLVSLEDTPELIIDHPNRVQFECNEDAGMSLERGVKTLMRFRPDRPVIGEVRDGSALDYLDALITGHEGGMSSTHAEDPVSGLYRIEDLARQNPKAANIPLPALRRKIASAIHYVVQAARHGGERFPLELVQVLGVDEASGEYRTRRLYYRYL